MVPAMNVMQVVMEWRSYVWMNALITYEISSGWNNSGTRMIPWDQVWGEHLVNYYTWETKLVSVNHVVKKVTETCFLGVGSVNV